MSTFDKLTYLIGADATEFREELERANRGFDRFRRKNRRSIRMVKRAIVGGTVAVTALGTAMAVDATQQAAKFERSLVSAGSKANATAGEMQAMKDAALEASSASEFSAGQAADAMGYLAQAGFEVQEQISALPGVLNLASAGELELASAADIASNVLTGFGKDVSELGNVNDILVAAANSANTSVTQLGDAMSYAAPNATGAGIEIAETASVIGKLSDAGIQGSRAGRGFNQVLNKMRGVAADLGVDMSAADVEAQGFAGSLARLEKAGLNSGNAVGFFGEEAGPAVQALLNQGTNSIDSLTTSLENAGGTAERVAYDKIETLSGSINVLTGNWQNLRIVIGDEFKPVVTESARELGNLVADLTESDEALDALGDTIIGGVELLGDLVIALGGVGKLGYRAAGVFQELGFELETASFKTRAFSAATAGVNAMLEGNVEGVEKAQKRLDDLLQEQVDHLTGIGDEYDNLASKGDEFGAAADLVAGRIHNVAARAHDARDRLKEMREEQERVLTNALGENTSGALTGGFSPEMAEALRGVGGGSITEPREESTSTNSRARKSKADTGKSQAEKDREDLERYAQTIRDEFQPATEKLDEGIERVNEAFKAGLIDEDEHIKAIDGLFDKFDDATKRANALEKEAAKLKEELGDVGAPRFRENLEWLTAQFEAGELTADQFADSLGRLREASAAFDELSRGASQLKEDLKAPEQVAREQASEYKRMLDEQLISEQQYYQAVRELRAAEAERKKREFEKEHADELERAKQHAEEQKQLMRQVGAGINSITSEISGHFFDQLKEDADDASEEFLITIGQMVAEAAAKLAILGAFQGAGGGMDTAAGSLIGSIAGFADGGHVRGPGTSTSDSIPARLSNNEFVMPASSTRQYGLNFMEAVRQGKFPSSTPQRFASGGLAKSGGGDGGGELAIANFFDLASFEAWLASQRGQEVMFNFFSANADEIDAARNQ